MSLFATKRPAWMEVDLAALQHNYRLTARRAGVPVMAVVKADAYGHGAVPVALALAEAGATRFAVATVDELKELRAAGIAGPVLVLGYIAPHDYAQFLYNEGIATVFSYEQAAALSTAAAHSGCIADVHIKIDTGMSRIGFPVDDAAVAEIARIAALPALSVGGIFSHLACADEPLHPYNERQLAAFSDMVERCRRAGVEFPLRHLGNSAAALYLPAMAFDMVRAGIILYGCYPGPGLPDVGLRPVMSVKARLARVFTVPAGTGVSYGCSWIAPRHSVLATLPLGYADGVPRLTSNRGAVLLHGRRAPIVGRVCMDQFMVDVTDLTAAGLTVQTGDEAVLIGTQNGATISADEWAVQAETITYELFCHLGQRLPRYYKSE